MIAFPEKKFPGWNILMKGGKSQILNKFKGLSKNYVLYLQSEASLLKVHSLYTC